MCTLTVNLASRCIPDSISKCVPRIHRQRKTDIRSATAEWVLVHVKLSPSMLHVHEQIKAETIKKMLQQDGNFCIGSDSRAVMQSAGKQDLPPQHHAGRAAHILAPAQQHTAHNVWALDFDQKTSPHTTLKHRKQIKPRSCTQHGNLSVCNDTCSRLDKMH